MSFLLVIRILNISLVTKIIKKIKPLCILFSERSAYRINLDETEGVPFLMKDK